VQDVEAFREKFGLKKFGLIGLSWGSGVAPKYITMYPQHDQILFRVSIEPGPARLKRPSLTPEKDKNESLSFALPHI